MGQAVRLMHNHFSDRLVEAQKLKGSIAVLGVDPQLLDSGEPDLPKGYNLSKFCCEIVEACAPVVVAVKLQMAFFEAHGVKGMMAFRDVLKVARRNHLLTIADGKRGDIPTVSAAYAEAYLGERNSDFACDALTLNVYMGSDAAQPFIEKLKNGRGIFVCVRTSNKSSHEFQNLPGELGADRKTMWEKVAESVSEWGSGYVGNCGLSSVGAVVGATQSTSAPRARELMPNTLFLVPGYGAQGAGAEEAVAAAKDNGTGVIVNASRSIMYAFEEEKDLRPADAAKKAASQMRDKLNSALDRKISPSRVVAA